MLRPRVVGVLDEDRPPPKAGMLTLFSAGSSFDVPEGSWMPPTKPGKPVQIGVRHVEIVDAEPPEPALHRVPAIRELLVLLRVETPAGLGEREASHHLLGGASIRLSHGSGGIVLGDSLLVEGEDGQADGDEGCHGKDRHQGAQEVARAALEGSLPLFATGFVLQAGLQE